METIQSLEAFSNLTVKERPGPSLVLYADDDVDDRDLMEECFASFSHHKLLTFCNGQDLLQFLHQMEPSCEVSLIILDINMPLMGGMEALQLLKGDSRLRQIPVVLFSTGGSPADRAAAEALETDIVVKSCSFRQMESTIKTLLTYGRSQEEGV